MNANKTLWVFIGLAGLCLLCLVPALVLVVLVRLALLAEIARQDIPYRNPDYNPVSRLGGRQVVV